MGDLWARMEDLAYPVAAEGADHAVSRAFGVTLDRSSDVAYRPVGRYCIDS